MTLEMNIFNVCKQFEDDDDDFQEVNMIETLAQDRFSNPVYDPLDDYLMNMTDDLIDDLDEDFFTLASHEDQALHIDGWKPRLESFEELPPYDSKSLSSHDSAPKLELKSLPSKLKYTYLGPEETFPVIISSKLDFL